LFLVVFLVFFFLFSAGARHSNCHFRQRSCFIHMVATVTHDRKLLFSCLVMYGLPTWPFGSPVLMSKADCCRIRPRALPCGTLIDWHEASTRRCHERAAPRQINIPALWRPTRRSHFLPQHQKVVSWTLK
jgi:hypothetical protein